MKKIGQPFDLLICSSGYEDRTVGFLDKASNQLNSRQAVILLYHPAETNLYLKNLENLEKIRNLLKNVSANEPEVIEIDPTDPWKFREILTRIMTNYSINPASRVLVDITSFTRVFLYELMKSLYSSGSSFLLSYTEPTNYVPTMAVGVNELVIAPSFMGKPRPNNKTFLLIFLGWETGRSKDTFENFNSEDHIAVVGIEPIDKKHIKWQQESHMRNEELVRMISNLEASSTLELEEICHFINRIYERKVKEYARRKENFDFAINGFGPKIQNVAISFFALTHKDIQLVYGSPSYWGASSEGETSTPVESRGIGESYLYGPYNKETIDRLTIEQ